MFVWSIYDCKYLIDNKYWIIGVVGLHKVECADNPIHATIIVINNVVSFRSKLLGRLKMITW